MNWQRLMVAILLVFGIGMASGDRARVVPINNEEADSLRQIPYSINTTEVQGATTIWDDIFGDDTTLEGKIAGEYLLSEALSAGHPINFVSVSKASGGEIGLDVIIWQEKETLVFNAENSAIAGTLGALIGFGVSEQQLVQAYPLIREHPRIPELRQILLAAKGYPTSDPLLDKIADIHVEIAINIIEAIRPIDTPPDF